MPWGRLDDQANGNAKLLILSDAAWRMWGCGLIFCQANLTDGFIPEHAIHSFGVRARNKPAVADELCKSLVPGKGPLWHKVDGGFQIHDYLDWNDSKDKILADREKSFRRLQKHRTKRVSTPAQMGFQEPLRAGVHVPQPQESQVLGEPENEPAKHPIRDFLGLHEQLFEARFKRKPSKYTGKEAQIAKRVIERYSEDATKLLQQFMASSDEFIERAGFGLNIFESQINKLIGEAASGGARRTSSGGQLAEAKRVLKAWGWCRHQPRCESTDVCLQNIASGKRGEAAAS